MLIVSAEEMRRLDNMAQQLGVPALLLMENAGRALADHAERLLAGLPFEGLTSCQAQAGDAVLPARLPKKQIAILAGPGQNGGDGFCAARHLAARGHEVKVGFFGKQAKLPEE